MPQKTRFTIYDAMEQSGIFSSNPANAGARDNDGNNIYQPAEYPKMLYHPLGEERIINPAEIVMTPLGAREYNEQRELIYKTAQNAEEEKALVAEGWLDHPAHAIKKRIEGIIDAGGLSEKEEKTLLAKIPKIALSLNREKELLAEIDRLKKERDVQPPRPRDALVAEPKDEDEDS